MSVINNVLKDLESKPSTFMPLELTVPVEDKQERNGNLAIWFIILLVVVVLGAMAYMTNSARINTMLTQSGVNQPDQDTSNSALVNSFEKDLSEPDQQVPDQINRLQVDNAIQGLHINETPTYLDLEFQLRSQASSSLRSRRQNRYVFFLSDVGNDIAEPTISGNPWLNDVQISQTDQGVEIQFDTKEQVLVETRENTNIAGYNWVIRFKKQLLQVKPEKKEQAQAPVVPPLAKKESVSNTVIQPRSKDNTEDADKMSESPLKLDIRPTAIARTDVQQLKEAIRLIKAARFSQASVILHKLLGGVKDRQARLRLIAVLQHQKQFSNRDHILAEGLKLYPDDKEFLLLEAERLFNQKAYAKLIQRFSAFQGEAKVLNLLAASYQRMDLHQQAIASYQKSLRQNAAQPRLWISLGISQQHQQQPEQALRSYQMAMRGGLDNEKLKAFVMQRIRRLSN